MQEQLHEQWQEEQATNEHLQLVLDVYANEPIDLENDVWLIRKLKPYILQAIVERNIRICESGLIVAMNTSNLLGSAFFHLVHMALREHWEELIASTHPIYTLYLKLLSYTKKFRNKATYCYVHLLSLFLILDYEVTTHDLRRLFINKKEIPSRAVMGITARSREEIDECVYGDNEIL